MDGNEVQIKYIQTECEIEFCFLQSVLFSRFVFRGCMTDYLTSDVNNVNVNPCVPMKDLVALQCNLFYLLSLGTHAFLCKHTGWMSQCVFTYTTI